MSRSAAASRWASPHCWDLFDRLADAGIALKLETDGSRIDDAAADRLAALRVQCVQISVDGATAATHERVRPGSSFAAATVERYRALAARGLAPQLVFVPTRFNLREIVAAFDLAGSLGCEAFVTGPLMRIGRAAARWDDIACSDAEWQQAVGALHERAAHGRRRHRAVDLSMGHPDRDGDAPRKPAGDAAGRAQRQGQAPECTAVRARGPAARFARAGVGRYRDAWRTPEVREFIGACRTNPDLLRHANETWPMNATQQHAAAPRM